MSHLSKLGGRDVFPFSAITGQEEMKRALILTVINPKIGGVLVFGEKGTAKSTAVRSLARLLPHIAVVRGCRFNCFPPSDTLIKSEFNHQPHEPHEQSARGAAERFCPECLAKIEAGEKLETDYIPMKVVDLPVSATEDRVVGALDIEKALSEGRKKFEAGVLAAANRGILYVDEVNLLDDHIVDLLLDSAAMGVNIVEREGISFAHPAAFILVGTMNPEEGELRPQLLDRFGLCVEIHGIRDAERRVEIVKLRGEFEDAPKEFIEKYHEQEEALAQKIVAAKELVKEVTISDELLRRIVTVAIELEVDGHRADLTLMKAAKANAAFEGRRDVTSDDIKAVAEMVFLHRMKTLPFENARPLDTEQINAILDGGTTTGGTV